MTQSLPTLKTGMSGNYHDIDAVMLAWDAGGSTKTAEASRPYILTGTGAPTLTAPQGTLYLRLDGSSTSTRAYINTTGSTTWTNITTAA